MARLSLSSDLQQSQAQGLRCGAMRIRPHISEGSCHVQGTLQKGCADSFHGAHIKRGRVW
eukprot:6213393-Pleurochrysis_carterae.AAC.2